MKNNFYIEVKTKWYKDDTGYYRNVIKYECDAPNNLENDDYAVKFLYEKEYKKEYANIINNNELEINAFNNNNELISSPNDYIKNILNYTKSQWNYNN